MDWTTIPLLSGDIDIDEIKNGIPSPADVKNFKMNPVEFEKVCCA